MNEYQNAGDNCAFLQCGNCRRNLYAGISQDIRSSSSHKYYYIVLLKNVAKLTGMHLHPSFFSTCNLYLHQKRRQHIYISVSFAKFFRNTFIMENLLWTGFERKTLWKMENQHSYYNKDISWSPMLFQKTDIVREDVSLRAIDRKLTLNLIVIFNFFIDISFPKYFTKIFCISYYFQENIWECFNVQLSVTLFVYILSSQGANQLQVLYIKTLGNIQENSSTEAAVLKCIPSIFFWIFAEVLEQHLKSLHWKTFS